MLINGEEHNDLCIGIDLGTTNSVLSAINLRANGNIVSTVIGIDRAFDMYNASGNSPKFSMRTAATLPSCVYYNEEKNFSPVVGDFAKSRFPVRPDLVAKSIKSQMGNSLAEGLSPNIPDKTPAQISARILRHLLRSAAKIFRQQEINDAIITVPASFDSIMCQATLDAAEIAGIKIRNADGSFRSILLPEPQAVIYDFINQVHNGEISDKILDLSSTKNVMVFDLGGGTLDITLHKISRREDAPDVLNVEDLAINRYTLLGGDDFDSALAEKMFLRYLEQYHTYPEIIQKIKREKSAVMPQLLIRAEELKIELSTKHSDAFGGASQFSDAWDDDEEDSYPVGGNISATGVAYDDNFSTQELEDIWQVFMGNEFKFDDYKNLDTVAGKYGSSNIIFPILDVLKKCSDKLGTDDFKIDAVIMNGGMSRFYMVIERLKKFFGFEPIVALDPDQSVARGAAVYHYFLHKYAEKLKATAAVKSAQSEVEEKIETPYIKQVNTILPDSLYLLTHGNRYEEIIKTGTSLPHESKIFTGFKLPVGANKISIPVARRNNDNSYSVIAKGNMEFPEKYATSKKDNFVAFIVSMNEQRIIRMEAYICSDPACSDIIDEGKTEIAIAENIKEAEVIPAATVRVPATVKIPNTTVNVSATVEKKTTGTPVNPNNALNELLNYCRAFEHAQTHFDNKNAKKYADLIRQSKQSILAASNPEEFAEPFFRIFADNENTKNEDFKMHMIIIGRRIGLYWTTSQKRRLANYCINQLYRELHFSDVVLKGRSVNTKVQAIYTLYMCGSDDDLAQLRKLHGYEKFHIALLYTHAMTKTEVDWLYGEFKKDYLLAEKSIRNGIQNTAHSLGIAYRLGDDKPTRSSIKKKDIVSELCKIIRSGKMEAIDIGRCFLALGLICDCRYKNELDKKSLADAQNLIDDIEKIYRPAFVDKFIKNVNVAKKMIQGVQLSAAEEEFLLIKIDD